MKSKYSDMTRDEMLNEESALRTALFNLRVQNTTKALENTSQIKATRRELARLLTTLGARQRETATKES